MRISRDWLSSFLDLSDISAEVLENILTTRVAEAEGVTEVGIPLRKAIVVEVKAVERFGDRGLQKVSVNTGSAEATVICGAPNCRAGMLTVFVPPGGVLRKGEDLVLVESREMGGIVSSGILVSEAELDVSPDHSGIIELPSDGALRVGRSVLDYYGGVDQVIEIDNKSLTHRPDLWSHWGFARELSGVLNRPLLTNLDRFADDDDEGTELLRLLGSQTADVEVRVEPKSGCRRFSGIEIHGLRNSPSPLWMRRRLHAVGAGVRNFLVDLSNYVMHDVGQPNHAYDLEQLHENLIVVRRAREGETFTALDGNEYELSAEDLVIADADRPIALAGVMGGEGVSIGERTDKVFLESANFDPAVVRLMAKRHGLRTDASNRFEKSLSPFAVPLALQRYVEILQSQQPDVGPISRVSEGYPEKPARVRIRVTGDYMRSRLSQRIDDATVQGILTRLHFHVQKEKRTFVVDVPYFRATRDIGIAEDLVEEVGRVYGYEEIGEQTPAVVAKAVERHPVHSFENSVRDNLVGAGFREVSDYSFMDPARAVELGFSTENDVVLRNPIDVNYSHMRSNLVCGMLDTLLANLRHEERLALFEFGRVTEASAYKTHEALSVSYALSKVAAAERRVLCLGYSSGVDEKESGAVSRPAVSAGADFYALSAVLARLVRLVTPVQLQVRPLVSTNPGISRPGDYRALKAWMHPHRAGCVELGEGGVACGVIAEVHPALTNEYSGRIVIAEVDVELLLSHGLRDDVYQALSRFPASPFEVSVVAPRTTTFAELRSVLTKDVAKDRLRGMEVLSVYEGKPLADGEKSVSVRLYFGSEDHTLSSEEVSALQSSVMQSIRHGGFELRS